MKWIDFEIDGALSKAAYEGIFDRQVENKDYVVVRKNIALLPIPDTFDEYVRGKTKQALRTNVSRGVKNGYFCSYFNGLDYIDDIMEINLSSEIRGAEDGRTLYQLQHGKGFFIGVTGYVWDIYIRRKAGRVYPCLDNRYNDGNK